MGFSKVFSELVERKERAENGKYNCIPFPFSRFRQLMPGVERGRYIIITAGQKIGKSKFADFMFVYELLFFAAEHSNFKFKVIYFTLEMSPEAKYVEFLSHLLYRLDNKVISPTQLKSTDNRYPVPQEILDLLNSERYQKYIKLFEECIDFVEVSNPTGINKYCRDYAEAHGKFNHIPYTTVNEITGQEEQRMRLDPNNPYTQDDEEEYRIVIVDNAANLTSEKGMNKMETIDKLSKYFITLRNQLKFILVLIQHQTLSKEGLESLKLDQMKPSSDGLADCKTTSRDCDMLIGIYSPFKFNKREYEGYDISKLKNYSRFMEVIEDRNYGANNNICPLFFNGASSTWSELPKSDDIQGMNAVYSYVERLEKNKREKVFLFKIKELIKRLKNG